MISIRCYYLVSLKLEKIIIKWYLNKYFSMIFIRCYYLVSKLLPLALEYLNIQIFNSIQSQAHSSNFGSREKIIKLQMRMHTSL